MSLGARMFLLFGGVIVALLAAEWWLVTSLRQQLREEASAVALEVGRSVLGALDQPSAERATGHDDQQPHTKPLLELVMPKPPGDSGTSAAEPSATDEQRPRFMRLLPAHPVTPREASAPDTAPGSADGARVIPVPTERIDALGSRFQRNVLLGSLAILVVGLVAVGFVARRITRPLRGLELAAAAIGRGRFGVSAPTVGEPFLDATIGAFNRMSTRLAELDAEMRRTRERAHLTEIGEIARGFAHSLRNPLNALGLSIQELAAGAADSRDRDNVLATCRAQIERIDRTLRSFLALSALGDREPRDVDVAGVAEDVAMEAAQGVGGSVRVELDAGEARPRIAGLAPELRSALHVLVFNAVEATGSGGTVSIRVRGEPGGARIEVEDDGPGLPSSVRERLFQPHVTTKEHGAGLGLFLAERIASRRYRGSLELHDRAPRGTRAILHLRDREVVDRG